MKTIQWEKMKEGTSTYSIHTYLHIHLSAPAHTGAHTHNNTHTHMHTRMRAHINAMIFMKKNLMSSMPFSLSRKTPNIDSTQSTYYNRAQSRKLTSALFSSGT